MIDVLARNFAFLVNTSQYWKNMRHSADIHIFYKILRENGFTDDDIIIYTSDDFAFDERITNIGTIYTGWHQPVLKKLPESVFTPEMVYETIMGNHEKLLEMDENSNFIIYLTGHGNTNFLKLHNKHFITSTCLEDALIQLGKRGVNKVLIISDTCKAESLIPKENLPDNIAVLYTSGYNQDSYSSLYSTADDICTVDEFCFFFQKHALSGFNKSMKTFFDEMQTQYEIHSDLIFYPDVLWCMSDFFIQNNSPHKLTRFDL